MKIILFFFLGWLGSLSMFGSTFLQEGDDEKLFTLLKPDQTNIYFNNELHEAEEYNPLLYSNFYGGGGVGIGDINNDGLQDIYFTGNLVADRLYLNRGNMVFEDITEKAGILDNGGWSSGVLMGDVNKDGWLDIYVTRELYDYKPELRRNKLYINNGNNTFTESAAEYGLDDDGRTRHATFIDYDKDGDLDLYLLNQPPNPGNLSEYYNTELLLDKYSQRLYENQGNTFVDVTEKAGLLKTHFPNSVTASDLNGDGWTDLYAASDYWTPDCIYINNGDGTFTDKVHEYARHITFSSMGIDAGDINNDGLLDLIILDMVPEDYYRLKTNMGGPSIRAFGNVVNEGGHYQYFTNTLQLNIGNNYYSDIAQLANIPSTDWSWSPLFADLDNDGWKDLFIANGLLRDIRDNDAAKDFPDYLQNEIAEYLHKNPDAGDVDIWDIIDMDKAIEMLPSVRLSNYAFKNNRDLTFSNKNGEWGLDQKTFSNGCAYADLDNDGDLDLVVNNVNDFASIFQNNAEKVLKRHYLRINPIADADNIISLGTKVHIETSEGQQFFEITSVRGIYSTSEQIAHFGLGDIEKIEKIIVQWPDGNQNILENVKSDQTIKVRYSESKPAPKEKEKEIQYLFTNAAKKTGITIKHQENDFNDFKTQVMLPHKMSSFGPYIATGDINADGLEDFFIGGAFGFEGHLFTQNSNGTFAELRSEVLLLDKIYEDMGALFFDADGDQDLDLYVVSGGNEFRPYSKQYQDRLYLNDGSGLFSKAEGWLPEMNFSGSKVYPEDFDQDGDIDLFVAGRHVPWSYPEPATSVLLLNENGKFKNVTKKWAKDLIKIGMVNDASWVDFNNDGLKDLVLAGEWMPITLFQNEGDKFTNVTESFGLGKSTGWWFSIKASDIDQDGDQDFIAGNLGLNYKYKASAEEPFEVYYYDFDNNGSQDIVLTHYNDGVKYPYRRIMCSIRQVPSLRDKFRTFVSYAKADVYEVYGKDNLERALHYPAYTFASAYIENKGNGQFELHELPLRAQFSSINDIIIEDFNADGHPDVLIAGNLYNSEIRTPRNDAGVGLLLAGDGKGEFTVKTNQETGFFVPYNVKSMALISSPEEKMILVGCNNDSLQVFRINK